MRLTSKQQGLIKRRKIVVLATADSISQPRAILVEVNKVYPELLIVTDNQMKATKRNLLENPKVAILAFESDYSYNLKINGEVSYQTSGKYFDCIKKLKANKNFSPKGAVVMKIDEVEEFT